jgi:Flp pilus assembly protein TadD
LRFAARARTGCEGAGIEVRAVADLDEAIKLNPMNATAYYNRGVTKKRKGDSTGGDADIARANELSPNLAR